MLLIFTALHNLISRIRGSKNIFSVPSKSCFAELLYSRNPFEHNSLLSDCCSDYWIEIKLLWAFVSPHWDALISSYNKTLLMLQRYRNQITRRIALTFEHQSAVSIISLLSMRALIHLCTRYKQSATSVWSSIWSFRLHELFQRSMLSFMGQFHVSYSIT